MSYPYTYMYSVPQYSKCGVSLEKVYIQRRYLILSFRFYKSLFHYQTAKLVQFALNWHTGQICIALVLSTLPLSPWSSCHSGFGTNNHVFVGNFFSEILVSLQSKVYGNISSGRKMHYYSSHDSTIVALQALLGIPMSSIIGVVHPGSAMIIELHQNSTDSPFYIEVIFVLTFVLQVYSLVFETLAIES